jgi:hypothetical protein
LTTPFSADPVDDDSGIGSAATRRPAAARPRPHTVTRISTVRPAASRIAAACRAGIDLAASGAPQSHRQFLLVRRKCRLVMNSQSSILRNRIKFAVRRCTGRIVDMDAMLGRPELREPRIRAWRQIGSAGLNELLDQLESEFQQDGESPADNAKAGLKVMKGIQLVPHPSRGA